MIWEQSYRADPRARELADRHYSRQTLGAAQFVPPGRCLVLYAGTSTGQAYWVTSWQRPEFTRHAWPGAWVCSAFRNEGAGLASELIYQGMAATRAYFGDPPPSGMITFINQHKVRPTIVRVAPTWGRCFVLAGFRPAGMTKGGLLALQILPEHMPPPCASKKKEIITR